MLANGISGVEWLGEISDGRSPFTNSPSCESVQKATARKRSPSLPSFNLPMEIRSSQSFQIILPEVPRRTRR